MDLLRLFPCGYPVDFRSESREPLDAARALWGEWPQLFDQPPVEFDIEPSADSHIAEPVFQVSGGTLLLSSTHAAGSFSNRTGQGWLHISIAAMRQTDWFTYYWLQPLVLTALDMLFFEPLHAACVSCDGHGFLLCGDSGAGKTTLAYACGKAGWTLISEDGVRLPRLDGPPMLVGAGWSFHLREGAKALFPELSDVPMGPNPAGKQAMFVDARSVGVPVDRTARVQHTVFLRRGTPRVSPFPAEQAVAYFLGTARNPDGEESRRRLRQMLQQGCSLLEYDDPAQAVAQLERLL